MENKIIVKGDYEAALNELKNDKNNSVASLFKKEPSKNKGLLIDAIYTIKENYATKENISSASSKILENFVPYYDATAIQKLDKAGAIKIAKVYCDELALGGTGTYSAYGLIRNPFDEKRLAGGSSSGSAATLTKNISFALGSDTGDSVRLPASYNGLVGFKPSYGAISRYGLFAFASSLDTVAYFAHNVNDISLISQALYGKDNKDFTSVDVKIDNISKLKPLKIGILDVNKHLEEFVSKRLESLHSTLIKNNIKVDLIEPNEILLKAIKPVYEVISFSEASSNLANLNGIAFGNRYDGENWEEIMTKTRTNGFGHMVQLRLTLGSYFLHQNNQKDMFIKAQQVRRLISDYFTNLHNKYDVLIYPAYSNVAPYIDSKLNKNYDYMEYILTGANLTGNPSITIPWIKKDNLFVNLTIDSKLYTDEKLLSYSLWIEELLKGVNNE
ncbi:aspartyl/glutamyl-tRNA(Asn/Gln) amidotransferase subunit A [Mycoplasmopsis maculosa]|uniref:Aspartyl/glutamyl-tRNA(Asn/Gln) amidotransferase subunit A n=1 Tax=Mycoplasmopsis maculosa TaxID=114885 RepID=A0A449B4M0_9BACT|nr:amidase family protein [Mycoplasmopsis maculosa]VEU75516.1 aspartyl/glutamyl-tRNA(Asn/Gln) amidotransferase subunit A [Mycoplasmopsis maculosa]